MPRARILPQDYLYLLVAAIPLVYLIICVAIYGVDVPVADQWGLVPLIEKSYRGTLSVRDLWSQHNEHRPLFPRAVMIILARLSGWNIYYELAANIAIAGATLAVLWLQVRRSARLLGRRVCWLLPILALALFSPNQAENWLAGWNIQIFLGVFAVVSGIVLLCDRSGGWGGLALAALMGIVAIYSALNGIAYWLIGIFIILTTPYTRPDNRHTRLFVWSFTGICALASYLYDYNATSQQPSLWTAITHLRRYIEYTLTYIGTPVSRGAVELVFELVSGDPKAICNLGDSDLCDYVNDTALFSGFVGIAILTWIVWFGLRRRSLFLAFVPYVSLILYALSSAALTSIGRASFGNHQALSQRYITLSVLFWVATIIMVYFCGGMPDLSLPTRRLSTLVIVLFIGLVAAGSLQGRIHFIRQNEFLTPARAELARLNDDRMLSRLFPDPHYLREQAGVLQRYHLSVFRAVVSSQ